MAKAKFDPFDFPFGANAPRRKKPQAGKEKKGRGRKSDAWRAYVGGARRRR
jgi:hypothetical protein